MNFSINAVTQTGTFQSLETDCLIIGVFEEEKQLSAAESLANTPDISSALDSGDMSGKLGTTLLIRTPQGFAAKRILLVGLGKTENPKTDDLKKAMGSIANALPSLAGETATLIMDWEEESVQKNLSALVDAFYEKHYRSDQLKSKKDPEETGIKQLDILIQADLENTINAALKQAIATANGVKLAKDLGNLPGNICTPDYLANTATELAEQYALDVEVLERKQIEALKMNSFLSVAKGSDEPPKFIVLKHLKGNKGDAPVVLVGKAITFDAGGISLKPGAKMDEMKYDMCGAAAVLGTMQAAAEMNLAMNLIAVIPACENLPSGRANKPGDIVTTMSGKTVEILNTDAEGRLILCDALTYTERFEPELVIDLATLTGACVVALGHHHTGLFTRDDEAHNQLATDLLKAGNMANDTAWRMPIDEAYQEQLKSNFADMANIGGMPAGSVTAACFLERYTKEYTWAHLDIAGTAWTSGAKKGSTGRPIPLLTTFLSERAKNS